MIENNFTERLNHPDDIKKYFSSKTFKDFLADKTSPLVYCTLSLDGKEFLNKSSFEIVLNQKTNDHDSFTITVPDDALDSFSGYVLENSKNILGKKITINFHRFGEVKNLFSGVIANIKNKKENGYGKLFITGFAPSILLESGKDCKSFEDKTLEQIIKEVTSEYPEEAKINASNIVNSSYPIPYTVQYKESDYGFIQRLAKRYGEYFYYNGQHLIFGNKVQPIISLEDGVDLIEAEFELSIKPQDFRYMVYDAEKGSKTEKDSLSTRTQYKENPFQAIAVSASKNVFKKIPDVLYNHTGIGSNTDKALSQAIRREKENRENLVTVTGKSKDPNLKIGGRAKLIDINNKAMETYRIIEIKHFHNGNEYYNEFVGIPDLFNAPYQDNEAFPIGEEQSAIVVDNNDAMGRVRVQFPWQEKKGQKTPWLRIATLHTGAGKGTNIIPEIGEEVLVAYESGNAEKPYVSGALYNGKEKSGYHTAGNDLKVIQTRSGCKIVINDEKGSILLQDAHGSKAFLDGQGNIDLNSAKKINLDSKEINLRAEKIKLESSEIMDIKSYQSAKFTSFQTMNIDSTKSLKVNSTNMSMNAKESFKTTAQNVDLGAEKQMKVSSQAMEVHGTDTMDLKSPTLNKVTQAEKVSASTVDEKGVQAIALIKPSTTYKGEFGIDYCEMDDKFEKIESFQGTKVSDVEYIFDKATSQYRKGGTDTEKQNLIKEMYYSKTYFGKNYPATWMNIKEGITANVKLTTFFIDKSKKPDSEKEFISFKENPNFEITYDNQKNNAIKIKVKDHKKEYSVEIKAIKSFETTEYIDIVDEEGNEVGIIEMAPNKVEELEIKIIPVVLKTVTPAMQDVQAEAIYNKAMTAKNTDGKNLTDTLTQVSLNQAGIKSKLVANPKGAEKVVIDITKEYKNYWDVKNNWFKEWTLIEDERDKSKNESKRPSFVYEDEDSNKHFTEYENKNGKELLKEEKKFLLNKLKEDYFNLYGRNFKGVLVFVTDLEYDTNEEAGAYSFNNPIRNQGVIVFKNRLENSPTYAHEIGHLLGLEHIFFMEKKKEGEEDEMTKANNSLKNNDANKKIFEDNIAANEHNIHKVYGRKISSCDTRITNSNENISDIEKRKKTEPKNEANLNNEINEERNEIKKQEAIKTENQKLLENEKKELIQNQQKLDDLNNLNSYYVQQSFKIKKGTSKNFMDYMENRISFLKVQSKIIRNEANVYYK